MVERNPWWRNVEGPFPAWQGPLGCKADGGGCHRASGLVGGMAVHRAACNRDAAGGRAAWPKRRCPCAWQLCWAAGQAHHHQGWPARPEPRARRLRRPCGAAVRALAAGGHSVNEVEAAGNTPLHSAAYEGWIEGVELLLSLGAKVDASNNAGDRPWHWADNMGHEDVKALLTKARGRARRVDARGARHPLTGRACAQKGARIDQGQVLVQDHVAKVKVRR